MDLSVHFCSAWQKDGVEVDQLASLSREQLEKYLAFANKFCAKSITKVWCHCVISNIDRNVNSPYNNAYESIQRRIERNLYALLFISVEKTPTSSGGEKSQISLSGRWVFD